MARLNWTLWFFATIVGVISSDITNGNSSMATYQRMMKLRHLAVEFFDFYENVTVTDLKPRIPTEQDLLCAAEVQQLGQALQSGSLWALRMIDSWGGLPSGLLHGNLKDLGNFDECIRIQHEMTTTGHLLRGKYCSAKLPVGSVLGGNSPALSSLSAQTAVCFPASCSAENIDALLGQLLQQLLNIEVNTQLINEANCQTAEKEPLDGLAIFTIVLFSILAGLMLLTTIWDYFFCHDQKRLPAVVQIFSARVNSRALFRISDSKSNPNVIDCLHGIRGLSLMWVIYGHDYLMAAASPNINLVDIVPWFKSPYSMFTIHALFSVDTFFFLSGLLIVLVALRTMEKTRGKLNVPLMYLHRFLRLTPVLALGILGYMAILPIIGSGPVYSSVILAQKANCEETWFWTLLYVQNYVAGETMCLAHSWYLGVDTQLYVISPLLLLALYKWGKKAVAGIVVFMLLLAACLFSMMMVRGYTLQLMVDSNKIYYTTHTRASPWIIGLLFGYFLHVNRGKSFKLKPLAVWAGWIFSLALIFACLFGIYPYAANGYELPTLNEAFYVTLTRIAWPLALVWVVFACKYGYGGLANSFLSSPLWQPLSKLSYCAYIWHFFIEELNGFSTHTSTYFSDYQVMLRFWPDFGFTVLLSYLMYILVEAPTGGIQTLLLPSGRPKASPPKADAPTIEPRINEDDKQAAPPVALKTPLDG
ncbi:nose resistant to fluoxetine protein 6-like [Drosophila sulfurigaster albostrigata]|uniref:nose resistant to fluoxetine protein 6-like n=1 Tax=Drosophila sulfurigaster albostrigata TaxID=89887 RepID=UPI002D21D315|nr:nose resistant to fluoxetine protein 6-like [Drosophila sulfurigaster albostrigata]